MKLTPAQQKVYDKCVSDGGEAKTCMTKSLKMGENVKLDDKGRFIVGENVKVRLSANLETESEPKTQG